MDDWITAFRALQPRPGTSPSRIEALAALFQELTPYEWRDAQELLRARKWNCDIVGLLPVELVTHVFSYLDTSTTFRLQLVSKRWRTLLQSPDVLNPLLNPWYDGTTHFEAFDYTTLRQKALRIHCFRYGYGFPLTEEQVRMIPFMPDSAVLIEDTLVGYPFQGRTLSVQNLRTGASWETQGDAREQIINVAASEQIVAFATTSNTCYVSDLAGGQKRKFKLFSNIFKALACRDRTVACGGLFQDCAEFYTWDFDSQKGTSFRIGYDQPPFFFRNRDPCRGSDLAILPNPRSKTLTVVTNAKCHNGCQRCQDVRFDSVIHFGVFLEGCLVKSGSFDLMLSGFRYGEVRSFRPIDRQSGYALEMGASTPNRGISILIQFDDKKSTFIDLPLRPLENHHPLIYGGSNFVVWWKDTFYQLWPELTPRELTPREFTPRGEVLEAPVLVCRGQSDKWVYKEVLVEKDLVSDFVRVQANSQLLLNDRHAVVISNALKGKIAVIRFEKTLDPPPLAIEEIAEVGQKPKRTRLL